MDFITSVYSKLHHGLWSYSPSCYRLSHPFSPFPPSCQDHALKRLSFLQCKLLSSSFKIGWEMLCIYGQSSHSVQSCIQYLFFFFNCCFNFEIIIKLLYFHFPFPPWKPSYILLHDLLQFHGFFFTVIVITCIYVMFVYVYVCIYICMHTCINMHISKCKLLSPYDVTCTLVFIQMTGTGQPIGVLFHCEVTSLVHNFPQLPTVLCV